MQRVTMLICEDLWDGLRLAASERGKSRQQFIREVLAQANGAAIAKRGAKAAVIPISPLRPTGYTVDWDKVITPEVAAREAQLRERELGAAPVKPADLVIP